MSFAKGDDYYRNIRSEVLPLIPSECRRVLEVGCGAGDTLVYLKENTGCQWIGGIEPNPEAAREADGRLDQVWIGTVEDNLANVPDASLDAVLCLDVLEHLIDPWRVLAALREKLRPGGVVVASIPNVRHYKVVSDLVLRGKWEYRESGVLDSTHLRFFVRSSIVELFDRAGLEATRIEPVLNLKPWKNKWIINKLAFGKLTDFYTFAYLVQGRIPE